MMMEEEEDLQKNKKGNELQDFYVTADGKSFDPVKKFGSIEDGTQLVYDNITTSYTLNLPADYYLKAI